MQSGADTKENFHVQTLNSPHCSSVSLPDVNILLRILSTLPVSTAEAERLFSKVTRTLSALRRSMNEDRLEALVLIETHRDSLPSNEDVVNRFMQSRRRMSS